MSSPASGVLDAPAQEFYRHALDTLRAADVPVLVGGAYAFAQYTGEQVARLVTGTRAAVW